MVKPSKTTSPHISQWKEDWKYFSSSTASSYSYYLLNEKRIESSFCKALCRPDTPSSMKRGLKGLAAIFTSLGILPSQWKEDWKTWFALFTASVSLKLNEKRIERSVANAMFMANFLDSMKRGLKVNSSKCIEDFTIANSMKRGLKAIFHFIRFHTESYLSMKRGLKAIVVNVSSVPVLTNSMKRGLKALPLCLKECQFC